MKSLPAILIPYILTALVLTAQTDPIVSKELSAQNLASYLNLYAASFTVKATGTQKYFSSRLVVYFNGKELGASIRHSDGTASGSKTKQEFTVILKNTTNGLEYWISHNASSWRGEIKLPKDMRPDTYSPLPRINTDGSISFAMKDVDNVSHDRDWAPSTGHLVVVLETAEEKK